MIETIRISEKGKQQLLQLKKKTGIQHWNVLCRWAFCLSLAEKTIPPKENIVTDSNIEMSWKTFAGKDELIYQAILTQRLYEDGLQQNEAAEWFKIHLHRGISYMNNKIKSVEDLVLI